MSAPLHSREHPAVGLAAAREACRKLREDVRNGADPIAYAREGERLPATIPTVARAMRRDDLRRAGGKVRSAIFRPP